MASREGIMNRKVREVRAREFKRLVSERDFLPPTKYVEKAMPRAVVLKQYEYVQRAQALRAIARGSW
jgi:hypothetical protein